ncbi:MAG: ShlB/FhaC/HecB family hemolysin secretion/activation protein [Methylotenera sp.]
MNSQRTVRSAFLKLANAFFFLPALAFAGGAIQPDAGRTIQEIAPPPAPPKPIVDINIKAPDVSTSETGGETVIIKNVLIEGNTVFDNETLLNVLGETTDKSYDLAGLKQLANQITTYYRNQGYPFARAIIPAQAMQDGLVKIEVIEGRYNGSIKVFGDDKLVEGGQKFLNDLKHGDVIENKKLERAMLILSDQPGFSISPLMSPGDEVGTANLEVNLIREKKYGGEVGLDNFGNRFTGRARAHANLFANSQFLFGDQFLLNTLYTEEDLWSGALSYSIPIGGSGLRARVGYAHTYYELGKDFKPLDANGTAKVTSAELSYPILRSQAANLIVAATYQYKKLNDRQDTVNVSTNKHSNSIPITLNFDLQDQIWGGGVTYGAISWTHGDLSLDSTLSAQDRITAKTEGSFDKFNLDIARIQALSGNFSFYGSLAAQATLDNLDSSEKFGLGGINGVRAYPSGEGFGDEGYLARLELRYALKQFTPYAFYDAGSVRINHDRFDTSKNRRSISGTGLGLRYDSAHWAVDSSVAWQGAGGDPTSDTKDDNPMYWLGGHYRF